MENHTLKAEVKVRFRSMWHTNCQCLAEYEEVIAAKDTEIEELKCRLRSQAIVADPCSDELHLVASLEARGRVQTRTREEPVRPVASTERRGKAPPIDPFMGEDPEVRIDEWLPSLERARDWNDWTEEELLL